MLEIHVDVGKNRVYVTIRGEVTEQQVREACPRLRRELDRLRPGFQVVSDVSGLSPSLPVAEQLCEGGRLLFERGASKLVRVVGRSAGAALLFERLSRAAGYSAHLAYSVEEAEAMLDAERRERMGRAS